MSTQQSKATTDETEGPAHVGRKPKRKPFAIDHRWRAGTPIYEAFGPGGFTSRYGSKKARDEALATLRRKGNGEQEFTARDDEE